MKKEDMFKRDADVKVTFELCKSCEGTGKHELWTPCIFCRGLGFIKKEKKVDE